MRAILFENGVDRVQGGIENEPQASTGPDAAKIPIVVK